MSMTLSKHHLFLLLGAIGGLVALLINNFFIGDRLAFAQMTLWTVLVFGVVGIQVNKSLWRPRQLSVALALVGLHFIGLFGLANRFPLNNMIVGFIGVGIEIVILIFLYVRIGQTVDPKGPYGLTDAEIHERKIKEDRSKQR